MKRKSFFIGSILLLALTFFACETKVGGGGFSEKDGVCTIIYYVDNGAVRSLKVLKDYVLTENDLKPAEKQGFEFLGWYNGEALVVAGFSVTEDLVLTAKFTERLPDQGGGDDSQGSGEDTPVAPGNVTNLTAIPGDKEVTLSWTNPNESIKKINVYCDGVIIKEVTGIFIPLQGTSQTVTGLENGKRYTFTVKTVDSNNQESEGTTCNFALESDADGTETTPVVLLNYVGNAGDSFKYVKFGLWPQTIKADGVTIDETSTKTINDWTCYAGSDGFYYVKETVALTQDSYKFSNNVDIVVGTEYYFKLEPITWRVLTDSYLDKDGQKVGNLLFAEKVLDTCEFLDKAPADGERRFGEVEPIHILYNNDYSESRIGAFLTGGKYDTDYRYVYVNGKSKSFLQGAFSQEQIDKINKIWIDNSKLSASTGCADDTINDPIYVWPQINTKIFLLSAKEIATENYGFGTCKEESPARQMKPTDYALAVGVSVNEDGYSPYWTRSPSNDKYKVRYIDEKGTAGKFASAGKKGFGVVPALTISGNLQ